MRKPALEDSKSWTHRLICLISLRLSFLIYEMGIVAHRIVVRIRCDNVGKFCIMAGIVNVQLIVLVNIYANLFLHSRFEAFHSFQGVESSAKILHSLARLSPFSSSLGVWWETKAHFKA